MKKLIYILPTLALAFTAVSANAAIGLTPTRTVENAPDVAVTCTGYFGTWNNSTKAQGDTGSCPGTFTAVTGNWIVLESAADQTSATFYEVTPTDTDYITITPDFSSGTAANTMTSGGFTGFMTGISAFLVSQLPVVLGVLAALIGLGFLIRRTMRWIGRKA